MFYETIRQFLISNHAFVVPGAMSVYTSTEQATAPTCAVCGRKLGVGYYYSCHVCSQSYCYAHAPAKCNHMSARVPVKKALLTR